MHTKPVKCSWFILVSLFYKNMSHCPLYKIEYLLQLKNIKRIVLFTEAVAIYFKKLIMFSEGVLRNLCL